MKKRSAIVLVSIVILIVTGFLLSTQFGVKTEKDIVVSKSIYEVSPVLTDLKNWPEWFADAGKYRFRLINRNPAGITVQVKCGNTRSIYSIVTYPDSVISRTHVRWTSIESGFDWIKEKLSFDADNPANRLAQLKNYIDDPRKFYGFDIQMGNVEDSLVLTKEAMVKKINLNSALEKLFKELHRYAESQDLPVNIDSCRMVTYYDERNDSIVVAAGIPVARRVSPTDNGIRLLEMPERGKMLVGSYQGPYNGLARLYRAMRKYVFDKKLEIVGAPYEKFLSRGLSPRDSLNMTIELHFPVL